MMLRINRDKEVGEMLELHLDRLIIQLE